jgi:hypothetical protein
MPYTDGDMTRLIKQVTVTAATPVSVADTNVTGDSIIIFSVNTAGGTVGNQPYVNALNAGVGFDVKATASDTSIYNYVVL